MVKTKKKTNKKMNISKGKKIALIVLSLILVILIIMVGYKLCVKYLFADSENEVKTTEKKVIELDNYDYYLHGNATPYEHELAEELKQVLSSEEINWEDYAKVLTKMFVSDLFTLENKNGSGDITSSQYVYADYQAMFKTKVKDTIYASIEIDLDGTRNQTLPSVTNVEVTSVTNGEFTYNGEVLDSNAYYVSVSIGYAQDLGYPTSYEVVLVKNNDLLQVVKVS